MKKNLELLEKKLTYKNYSPNTIKVYIYYAELFLKEVGVAPSHITLIVAQDYLLNYNYSSTSQQNQIIGAVKAVLKHLVGKSEIHLHKIERPRKEKKLPLTISAHVLKTSISQIKNLKHKAILSLAVTGALRVSEVIN